MLIDAWWAEADYNLALCPDDAGWAVIDVESDCPNKPDLPATYTVRTPRGGWHYYFEGEIASSVQKLGPKIDTRGIGGYVLLPPSAVAGKPYKVEHDRPFADLPAAIRDSVKATVEHHRAGSTELDLRGNVDRARTLLADGVRRGDIAREGSGGDDRTYRLACELLNLGLSPEMACSLLEEIWNPHCEPPWTSDELGIKVRNASEYAQNDAGAWAVAPAAEAFGAALDKLVKDAPPERRSRFHLEDEDEQDNTRDPEWLIPGLIQRQSTVLLVGQSRSYKSFLALDILLAVAAGVPTFGAMPAKTGPTIYAANEGRNNIKKARRLAWRVARGVEGKMPFYVTAAPMVAIQEDVQEFGDMIATTVKRPEIIVIDTMSKAMAGLNENDARDMNRFVMFCDSLRDTFGCTVIAIHHSGKNGELSRGSGAAFQGFDTVLEAKAVPAARAVEVWVRKQKDGEEREAPWTFEGKPIGQSLVFFETDAKAHRALTAAEDMFDTRKIGAALKELGAVGEDHKITRQVLALHLTPSGEFESTEDHADAVARTAKVLGLLSKTTLEPYCLRSGRETLWFLPA